MKISTTVSRHENKTKYPIIGIGASDGGLSPFAAIVDGLPEKFDASVVIMQRRPTNGKGAVQKIISAETSTRPIIEIADAMPIENGKVYINPPTHDVTVKAGHFHLRRSPKSKTHFPVDALFTSIAEEAQDTAIAVVLSGAGTDGARGIRDVQCKGGAVLVQDPATAEYAAMPRAAVESGNIDEVLALENIAGRIVSLTEAINNRERIIGLSDQAELDDMYNLLHEKTGYGFEYYKNNVVARRALRRMSLHGLSNTGDYRSLLNKDPEELGRLASDLMIGVTGFFRDPGAWESLNRNVIKKLIAEKKPSESIRVWTPGCSTGEEAYSIAMMLLREIESAGKKSDFHVFATDINEKALVLARRAEYASNVATDIPADYLKEFFTYTEDGLHVRINKYLRDHVVFAKQNLLVDPPFSRLDLLICRNLFIYLEPEFQDKCISIFHYALNEKGYLFLGNAESTGRRKGLFKPLSDTGSRLYQRITQTKPVHYSFPASAAPKEASGPVSSSPAISPDNAITEFAREKLLSLYAPASVLINFRYEILYFNGPIKKFMELPSGRTSFDFISRLPEPTRNLVRGALYNASQTLQPVSIAVNLPDANKSDRTVTLTARYCNNPSDQSAMYLIAFTDQTSPKPPKAVAIKCPAAEQEAIRQLEGQLSDVRDELQTTIEELRSAGEEMQASNEMLETSREELQSLNEALVTTNAQLQTKIEEQETTNDDLNNFFSSTDIPTLFLDRAFNVRRFTPAMTGLIKLIPSDAGRSISDISIAGLGADLLADARAVLDRSSPLSREIPMDGAWYIRSTLPYKTGRNRIDGVVITFVDITGRKEIELELQKRQIELDSRFNSSKRSAEELKTINEELFRFNRVAVDRELRMIELKGEVNELNNLAGQKPRYNLDFAENLTDIPSTLKGIK